MTGILLSLKGGVMKPMRNRESEGATADCGGMVEDDDEAKKDVRKRLAMFLIFTSRGRSLED